MGEMAIFSPLKTFFRMGRTPRGRGAFHHEPIAPNSRRALFLAIGGRSLSAKSCERLQGASVRLRSRKVHHPYQFERRVLLLSGHKERALVVRWIQADGKDTPHGS